MSGHFSHKLRGSGESVVSSVYVCTYTVRTIVVRRSQRVLQPEDVIAGNYERIERKFIWRQTLCEQAGYDATVPSATMHLDARRAL